MTPPPPSQQILSALRRHRGWLLVLLLVMGGVAGGYWYTHRLRLRLVTVVPLGHEVLTTEPALIVHLADSTVARFDWQGRELWRVEGPAMDNMEEKADNAYCAFYYDIGNGTGVSPNGHYLAMAVLQGKTTRVWVWRDGAQVGDFSLALNRETSNILTPFAPVVVYPQDTGLIYVVVYSNDRSQAVLALKDGRIIARGAFPVETWLSPSGQYHLVEIPTGWRYCVVKVTGQRVTLAPRFTMPPCAIDQVHSLPDGRVICGNTLYRADGTCEPAPKSPLWKSVHPCETLVARSTTANGRAFVEHTTRKASPPPLLSGLLEKVAPNCIPTRTMHAVRLYTAPRYLQGYLTYHENGATYPGGRQVSTEGYPLPDGRCVHFGYAFPAPDGHGLIAVATDIDGQHPTRVLLFFQR